MRRLVSFASLIVVLTVCTALGGKQDGKGGGGKGAAKAARAGGGGGGAGRGMGAGMGRAGGGRNNAFRGGQGAGSHREGGAGGGNNAGQRGGNNAGQRNANAGGKSAASSGRGLHARGANGFRNATGIHHQALHSHTGFARTQGITRVNHWHVQKYSVVVHNYHHVVRDRVWWTSHYSRVVLVDGGGWYYWDAGYWYPAWGYDPAFAGYAYDGPIYSYDNLPPDQVIINVQTELRFQGYYDGPIDGQLGPQTRAAISEYQRDHDLERTEVADEPTVDSLGLV